MNKKILQFIMLLAIASMARFDVAGAEDFNFTVPVELKGFKVWEGPESLQAVSVVCEVLAAPRPPNTKGEIVGGGVYHLQGPEMAALQNGQFAGNVAVRFNAPTAALARSYECYFRLQFMSGLNAAPSASDPNPLLRPLPNTAFVPIVSGPVTQSAATPAQIQIGPAVRPAIPR